MNNLITRTISGIFFVAVMVGAILYDAKTFIVLFGIITALAVWEFCTLVNNKRELQVNRLISRRPVPVPCNDGVLHGCVGSGNIHSLPHNAYVPTH